MTVLKQHIEKDHKLEAVAERTSEELAEHRWHMTLNPDGPGHSYAEYAEAIGHRGLSSVKRFALAHAMIQDRDLESPLGPLSITQALDRVTITEETITATEIIAEVEGVKFATVRSNPNISVPTAVAVAKERAEKNNTTMEDELRAKAVREKQHRESEKRRKAESKKAHTYRWMSIEGDIATAHRKLSEALREADGVDFTDDEKEMMRHSLGKLRALLNLLDLSVDGAPDIDWDAELTKLGAN